MAVVYSAVLFISVLDVTVVNVALPSIAREFGIAFAQTGAVSTAYLTALAIAIPASGRLGDRFGGKWVLLAAIALFTGASGLCGIAPSFPLLVAARALQGVGGGVLIPVGLAMQYRVFPPAERMRVSAATAVVSGLAPVLGPVVGGLLTTAASWQWALLVNVPIGAFAFTFGAVFVVRQASIRGPRFDFAGLVLVSIGFAGVLTALSAVPGQGWRSAVVVIAATVGVVALGAFVFGRARRPSRVLDLGLFRDRLFRSTTAVTGVGIAGFYGVLTVLAEHLQAGFGLTPFAAGLAMLPEALAVLGGAQLVSRVVQPALGSRTVMTAGLVVCTVAVAAMALPAGGSRLWPQLALLAVLGFGWSWVFVPASVAAFARIPSERTGGASTIYSMARQLGGAAGIATLASAMAAGANESAATRNGFVGACVCFALAAVLAAGARTADDRER
jgi:EmrB/QacA subfamily drug resistance transporter